MMASLEWIKSFLSGSPGTPAEVAEALTLSGSEVEAVEPFGDDHRLSIGITSNRVDCLGHLGLAREVAALRGLKLTMPPTAVRMDGPATSEAVKISIEDVSRCRRYIGIVVEGVTVRPSPQAFVRRLEAIGLRPINNVVDVTNYVLHELNQPLHAFDLDALSGPEIRVRTATVGERLKLLDGRDLALTSEDLVIADASRALALAGVMGGEASGVAAGTRRVLLESAWFEPATVRRSARRHGLATDSSHRFERRVDRAGALTAALRAAYLLVELAGGTVRRDPIDIGGPGAKPMPIALREERIAAVIGAVIPSERVVSILTALECEVQRVAERRYLVTPPSFRADLCREIDLIEELIRVHGLHHVPASAGMSVRVVARHPGRELREELSERLVGFGFFEAITPDFVAPEHAAEVSYVLQTQPLEVRNPVRQGEGALRRSLLPSLLAVRRTNQDRGRAESCLFESARVLSAPAEGTGVPAVCSVMGILHDGDPRELRGVIEALLGSIGVVAAYVPADLPALAPGSAMRVMAAGDVQVGVFGVVAAGWTQRFDGRRPANYAELNLDALLGLARSERRFRPLPRFPAIERDLAVVLAQSVPFQRIEALAARLALRHCEGLALFDLYRGKGMEPGQQSVGLRLCFRAEDRTLTSDEVDAELSRFESALASELGGKVRRA